MDWRCGVVVAFVIPVVAQVSEIPADRLKPDATLAVELERSAVSAADALWIPVRATATVIRVDAKNNAPHKPIPLGKAPCASVLVSADALWTAACDGASLSRVDLTHGNVSAAVPVTMPHPEGAVAVAAQSLWVITDEKGVVARIDHAMNVAVAEIYVASRPFAIAAGEDSVWVTSEDGNLLTRVNPETNLVMETIKVGSRPGPLSVGEGSVWVLNRSDGSVSRVDPKANKVTHTIPIGASVASGMIATGEGAVWVSAQGTPLVRIDPRTNRVTHRFVGEGGGALVIAHGSVWVNAVPKTTWRLDPKLIAALRP